MNSLRFLRTFALCVGFVHASVAQAAPTQTPYLEKHGTVSRLVVDGAPFLIRGGELNNSSATNPAYLKPYWTKFSQMNLNSLVVPAYWDLIEPREGEFDFSTVDALLTQAREARMRLVLLWFGTWKNSMSCYAPAWVKQDSKRFPRACDAAGVPQEILSPFSTESQTADCHAFARLMKHLKEVDGEAHTVIMIQVENEIGMIPSARDHSDAANAAFASAVPDGVFQIRPAAQRGTWKETYGDCAETDELFMAWHFGRYVEAVTAAGKKEYALPMFVNAALIRPGYQPGQYPSAGPLPHLFDVWRQAAPSIDLLSPDIYFNNFTEWTKKYSVPGNTLFIPEALRSIDASVNGLYAYGEHQAIGFSPFGIDSIADLPAKHLTASFGLVAQLEPLLLENAGRGTMRGFLQQGPEQKQPQEVRLGNYLLSATFEKGAPAGLADGAIVVTPGEPAPVPLPTGGLVIQLAPDEYLLAGTALVVTFREVATGRPAGILSVEEGRYVNGTWQNILWLGGDQTHQGRHARLEPGRFALQRVKLYHY